MSALPHVALVTGASRGIGRAIALRLAVEGFNVAVSALHPGPLDELVREIESFGREAIAIGTDITDRDAVFAMARSVHAQWGRLDVVVANAGIVQVRNIIDVTPDEFTDVIQTNLYGTFWTIQAAAEIMIPLRAGKIVLASSISGHQGYSGFAAYCATKFAIVGLTQVAAKEFAQHGITVNAYCPGVVATDMWGQIADAVGPRLGISNQEVMESKARDIALGRLERPEDVAGFVAFLASSDSDYMTGQSVVIDGGVVFR